MNKARQWLDKHGVEYEFHDYRKQGVPEKQLQQWVKQFSWETVLNKRGTTWRKLDEDLKQTMDANQAIQAMLEQPGIIKRPVLVAGKTVLIGFSEKEYGQLI